MVIRKTTIGAITSPTAVRLRGHIVSPNTVVSPITRRPAAVLCYYALANGELVHHGVLGEHVVVKVRTARLLVSTVGLDVYFRGANPEPIAVPHWPINDLPLNAKAVQYCDSGSLWYRELTLESGQPVRFRGTIAPLRGGGAYRTSFEAEFGVVDGNDPAVLSADVAEHA